MSEARITMGGKLPDTDELNGLGAIGDQVVTDPEGMRVVAVVVLAAAYVKHNVATGENVPQMSVARIEPILIDQDRAALGRIVNRAHEKRTGRTVLPLDLEAELTAVFGKFNPDTGEIEGDA